MKIYPLLYEAYDYYNKKLFSSVLPEVVITVERKNNFKGYFCQDLYENSEGKTKLCQITLNPSFFKEGNEKAVFSTLVHEMCHLKTAMDGENLSTGYHSKAWADLMESIGLIPTSTGKEGGKKTGFKMTHMIVKGGKFDLCTQKLFEKNLYFDVTDFKNEIKVAEKEIKNETRGTRIKYSCGCTSFWGGRGIKALCSKCGKEFININ